MGSVAGLTKPLRRTFISGRVGRVARGLFGKELQLDAELVTTASNTAMIETFKG